MLNKEKRHIPKLPSVPLMSPLAIDQLTQLCFKEDSLQEADAILVFGTSIAVDATIEALLQLLHKRIADKVILTGGMPNFEGTRKLSVPESQTLYDLTASKAPSNVTFFLEKESTNTLENIIKAKPFLADLKAKKVLYLCRSFAAGRCFLTAYKHLPNITLVQSSYHMPALNTPKFIRPDNWFNLEEGRQRVWGEFLRIREYGKQKDIDYDLVKEKVELLEGIFELDRNGNA